MISESDMLSLLDDRADFRLEEQLGLTNFPGFGIPRSVMGTSEE